MTLRVTISGDDICRYEGEPAIVCSGPSPVLAMCRELIRAGKDPGLALEAWRGKRLALRIERIGRAAEIEAGAHGMGFRRRKADKHRID